ncbi:helix-turn-helix domain-containing protein [Chitinophaga arvensicola]|uniref:Transcriptional regulator, contains XRE-family HTH domain n=1 Tax=Chitinophaga arvensicola TaxID=29529 RepID=A0A1I0S5J1_9BACT|nr:helix-turn-helix domain-containing protein [Chitinophaga arvensicola]SEW49991.1 Transcriptional regulator, contains XRE-family HTH domain [Chitinophaga arvensicola]
MSAIQVIGSKIAEARKKINMSQAQLARRLFISAQAVGKWERGESMPDIITFNRLAEMLGVDLNYFSESVPAGAAEAPATAPLTKEPAAEPSQQFNWDMSGEQWIDADFSGIKNLHEQLNSAHLLRCKFIDSDLSGLLLKGNHVENCNFSGADMSNSRIQRSYLDKNICKNSLLKGAEFFESFMKKCDFSDANFTGAVLKSGSFLHNNTVNAVWKQTSFIKMQIENIVFNGILEDCCFDNCAFDMVTFERAILTNTLFKNKSLKWVRFIDCQADRITYEFLKKNGKADLSGITLITS